MRNHRKSNSPIRAKAKRYWRDYHNKGKFGVLVWKKMYKMIVTDSCNHPFTFQSLDDRLCWQEIWYIEHVWLQCKDSTPPKKKRNKFYVSDYRPMDERHSGRHWDQTFHERPFRRRNKRYIQKVSELPVSYLGGWHVFDKVWYPYELTGRHPSDGLCLPKLRRPYVYYW